ncbi:thermostable hemolysin [Pseudohalocynthiibacter aestuariivivens]|uniref:Thermostable hemolysin n=1 Tax=Pseudohalocynthiibacter aestuariivivens TaxID=1591409 RepID=A0ABV5J9X5_9RHOB|nr:MULTISPECIES: thermostable hemolysin [Pseudohalocynthiibacter]MBS9716834.1 thermostable hemolysin [Pseudohalocynthiibacter aestuariivivens]MCK0102073.1 thermostable hemolysin [Pseudohalocynthiibacter sp. F2068]
MKIEFLEGACAERMAAQNHIRKVYQEAYGAELNSFAPLLVTATNAEGKILCAAGIRTATDGFFSDTYLDGDFSTALLHRAGISLPAEEIMEVVSLASITQFPVLPVLDSMISWGRERGMTCGVFTATAPLRRLLKRTGLTYIPLCPASPACVPSPANWGSYYETDPWVCAFSEAQSLPVTLSPRHRHLSADLRSEAS